LADLAEKYCLLLATAPGRAGLVVVLGSLVVSCNWMGWLAFWVSLIDASCLVYVWQTHRWFVANADNPVLFRSLQLEEDTPRDAREVAE
jgi:hypothetical protein